MMNYDEIIEKALKSIIIRDMEEAQALATLAVADRLDRLCKIMSRTN